MKFHNRGAGWFLTQMKANCAKIAEMNINCERFQTSACPHGDRGWTNLGCGWDRSTADHMQQGVIGG
jgi:hypothetical protein